jgi:hypothetical protein
MTVASHTFNTTWTGQMVDENTIRLRRNLELVQTDVLHLLESVRTPTDLREVPGQSRPAPARPVPDNGNATGLGVYLLHRTQ